MPAGLGGEPSRADDRPSRVEWHHVQVALEHAVGGTDEQDLPAGLIDVDEVGDDPVARRQAASRRAVGGAQLEMTMAAGLGRARDVTVGQDACRVVDVDPRPRAFDPQLRGCSRSLDEIPVQALLVAGQRRDQPSTERMRHHPGEIAIREVQADLADLRIAPHGSDAQRRSRIRATGERIPVFLAYLRTRHGLACPGRKQRNPPLVDVGEQDLRAGCAPPRALEPVELLGGEVVLQPVRDAPLAVLAEPAVSASDKVGRPQVARCGPGDSTAPRIWIDRLGPPDVGHLDRG